MADPAAGMLALTIHTTILGGDAVLVELNRAGQRGTSVIVPLEVPPPWVQEWWTTPEAPDGG